MPSKQSLKLLRAFDPDKQYIEGNLPKKVDLTLLNQLIDKDFVSVSRLPPEGDPLYPYGAKIYRITSLGLEVLAEESDRLAEKRLSLLWSALKYLIAWAIGVATPRIASLIERIPFVQHWLDLMG